MLKSSILKGTFILTIAGFLTRILGFFYKIFLSSALGAENLGIYQLIFPIYSLCFTLYAGGIQTAISKLVAAQKNNSPKEKKNILAKGIALSFSIACFCSILLYHTSDFLAVSFIKEERCANSLRLLCCVLPFCSITSCINGFYYGMKKTSVPAITQLIEQSSRIIFSLAFVYYFAKDNTYFSCEFAVFAIAVGEFTSMVYNLFSLLLSKDKTAKTTNTSANTHIYRDIIAFALPLTSTHLVISLLHSLESILIPNMLKLSGMSTKGALSIYGILTGMSMSLLMFPSTITNSLSVLLLPSVSEAQANSNHTYIKKAVENSVKYCLLIGLFCTTVFLIFGKQFGILFFDNTLSGTYLQNLSLLCPFLYLGTTLTSILNGIGKTALTFFNTLVGLLVRIMLFVFLIPKNGIGGYFIAMLISQLIITVLNLYYTYRQITFQINHSDYIIKPTLLLLIFGFFIQKTYLFLNTITQFSSLILLGGCCLFLLIFYTLSLKIQKII